VAIAILALLVLGGGVYAFINRDNPPVPGLAAACPADPAMLAALKAAAIGETAGVSINAEPRPFPDLAFKHPDGSSKTLATFKGKVLLVNLWATWCAPCREEMPELDQLQAKRGGSDFEVVAVNVDTRNVERATDFLDEIGVKTLTRYADHTGKFLQDMKRANRAPGLPSTLLLDRNGCELGFLLGPAKWASEDALKLIDAALAKS
jgi:thiol-disulfide isomerase/thioredoxin